MNFEQPTTLPLSHESSEDIDFELNSLLASDNIAEQDDMFELNNLLHESLNRKKDEEKVKQARRRLAAGNATTADREEMTALVRAWELRREWLPVSNTIMFEVQHCTSCGHAHKHLIGFFQQQEHRTSKISRWLAAPVDLALPKNTKENASYITICSDCCGSLGWTQQGDIK